MTVKQIKMLNKISQTSLNGDSRLLEMKTTLQRKERDHWKSVPLSDLCRADPEQKKGEDKVRDTDRKTDVTK